MDGQPIVYRINTGGKRFSRREARAFEELVRAVHAMYVEHTEGKCGLGCKFCEAERMREALLLDMAEARR